MKSSWIKNNLKDLIFLVMLSLGAIYNFYSEIQATNPSQQTNSLFRALEFIFSLGIGWCLQRISSREEFQESLHKFAFSAYRRIKDIDRSVNKISSEIRQMRFNYPIERVHELDLIGVLAEEMNNTVNSSIADWGDIIGDDLKKKERIDELENEKLALTVKGIYSQNNTEINEKISEVKYEIQNLRAELPYIPNIKDEGYPRGGRISTVIMQSLISNIETSSCIFLKVANISELSKNQIANLINNQSISFCVEQVMIHLHFGAFDKDFKRLGEVENPFSESDVYGNDYVVTVMDLLNPVIIKSGEPTGGPSFFSIPNVEFHGGFSPNDFNNTNIFYVKVPLTIPMIAKG
jgi:hypothetical protein